MRSLPVIVQVGKPCQGVQSVRQSIRHRMVFQCYRRFPCQVILPLPGNRSMTTKPSTGLVRFTKITRSLFVLPRLIFPGDEKC